MGDAAVYIEKLKARLGDAVSDPKPMLDGIQTVEVKPTAIIGALKFLHEYPDGNFDLMTDLTAIDWLKYPETGERFEVVYLLCSTKANIRIRLKCRISELNPRIESAVPVYKAAEWLEREVYDLFGIYFVGHPDLRRIMLWEEFEGHPLRKDFPTRGLHPVERTPKT